MLIHLSITYLLVDRMDLFAYPLSLYCFPYISYLVMDVYMLYGCLFALWMFMNGYEWFMDDSLHIHGD